MQRWKLDIPEERSFKEFRNRVTKVVDSFIEDPMLNSLEERIQEQFASYNGSNLNSVDISGFFANVPSFPELVLAIQKLFWAIQNIEEQQVPLTEWNRAIDTFIRQLNTALDRSPGINLRRLERSKDGIELYPEGIEILDLLIDTNAIWLAQFPDVAKEYKNALRIAAMKEQAFYRQALDSLRYAFEKLLKIVLDNNSPIEKQKDSLLKWMKSIGVHSHIRSNYTTLLSQFSSYQNSAVKHDQDTDPVEIRSYTSSELEYMLYLTSTLMRLVIELHRQATVSNV